MNTLNTYKNNIFSQFGEDGIIKEILRRLNISSGTAVEFGAWDGVLLSNTAALWTGANWKGVLIEAGTEKFDFLKKVCANHNCVCINEFVKPTGVGSLEDILDRNNIQSSDITLLSIDIDGNEYHILNGFKKIHPTILIMEYNPTIPPEMFVVSKEDAHFGSSALALCTLAKEKGYKLVAMTNTNCLFVDEKYSHLFEDLDTSFDSLFDRSGLTYLITGYRGNYAFSQTPAFGMGLPLEKELIEKGDLFFMKNSPARVRWNRTKDNIKAILKKIIPQKLIVGFRHYRGYILWKIKGQPIPAHMGFKWSKLREYAKKHSINTFIETGTAGGGTVTKMSPYFKQLYTIELDPTLFHQGKARVSDIKNIECLHGDSGEVLKEFLPKLTTPSIFWLDAHFSGTGTAKGALDTPIIQELVTIFAHPIKKHVLVIDDMREFNGTNDYPPLDEFKKFIETTGKEYTYTIINDIMVIEPKTFSA